jgi:hypothetical protein
MLQTIARRIQIADSSVTETVLGGCPEGRLDVLLRAEDSGIFIGGPAVNATSGGFELLQGVEYRFEVLYQDVTNMRQFYATTSSSTPVHLSLLAIPKL